jgi:3-oxoacyl-[acyl-carrier protein] reductase
MFDLGLEGKTAIVTGGSRGIGRAIAEKLAENKVNVVITGRNLDAAEHTADEIAKTYNIETLALQHDVTSEESTKDIVKNVLKRFDRIDILVNNAGIIHDNIIMLMKNEEWDSVLSTNLTGAFYCTKHIGKYMLKQKYGRIVNITSVVGIVGNVGQSNYSAAKAGLIGFTKSTAKELSKKGITDMTHTLSDKISKEMLEAIPIKSYGTPDDVANCVLFLVSNMSRYITGQVINVDGGMVM